MKKRLKKKLYKEVVRAKNDLNEKLIETISEGFFDEKTRKSRRGLAIRKVVNAAGGVYCVWRGWNLWLPTTWEAMVAPGIRSLPLSSCNDWQLQNSSLDRNFYRSDNTVWDELQEDFIRTMYDVLISK